MSGVKITGVTTATGGVVGDLTGNVTGDVTGNADSATALETARTIGGVSFDGSANINLPGVNQAGNQDTSGNAATATALETARTIGGVSFDGSANINLPGVNQSGTQDTSGNAATATLATNASGLTGTPNVTVGVITATDLTLSGNLTVDGTTTTLNTATLTVEDLNITVANGAADSSAADGAGLTVDGADATFIYTHSGTKWVANKSIEATSFLGDVTGDVTGTATTATNAVQLQTARNIGGVSFDGSADINLPGVNASGNQDTSGNAATATTLETARTIAGVSFDGSANISLNNNAITNGAGYVTSSGTVALAEGLTGTPNINVGVITATSFSGDGSGLTGVASTDNIQTATKATFLSDISVAGVTTATNKIEIRSDDSTPGRMDFYCETSNAHYTRLQSQAHANYSGNVTLTLPKVSGTAIVGGSNSNDTNITTTGDVSAANFNSTSDITLKDNVSIIDNALDMINNLEGISWNWKNNGKASLGVSAQNVETVAPELVNNSASHKSVNYNGLIGILIEAVKEQGNQISELRTELAKKANSRRKRS